MIMTPEQLTKHEKLVLFALAEDAMRTDAAVASRVDIKESTVGENRRKLIRKGYLRFVNVPSYHKLGFELAADIHRYDSPSIRPQIARDKYASFFRRTPRIFDAFIGEGYLGCIGLFEDYTAFSKFIDEFRSFLVTNGIRRPDVSYSLFPFESSRCTLEFNLAPSLNRTLDLGIADVQPRSMALSKRETVQLTKREAVLFSEMISSPMKSDKEIAVEFRRSRSSITEMRNRLVAMGLFSRIAIPSFKSMAPEYITHVYASFEKPTPLEEKNSIAGEEWWQQALCVMEKDSEFIVSYLLRNNEERDEILKRCIRPFYEAGILASEPKIYSHSLTNSVDFTEYAYGSVVEATRQFWCSRSR